MWSLLLNRRALAAIALAVCAWYAYSSGRQSGMSAIQAKWDAEKLQTALATAKVLEQALKREQALQAQTDTIRRTHREQINRLAADHAAALDSLRNRPQRPADGGVPEGASPGAGLAPGCTGAQLYREDAAVALGLARDADRLRIALGQCQAQYDAVRAAQP